MFHTYDEAVEWIHSLLNHGIKPGLQRMEWLLERVGNPERRLKCVHVGGTNGKGSTISLMRHILQDAGFVTGTFTSPYIKTFNERIAVDGEPIPDEDLLAIVNDIYPLVKEVEETDLGSPTEFEVITLIGLIYFGKVAYPDIVLIEVGLGGRLDSTNVIYPLVSVITNVSYDHMHILGHRIEEIAFEKSGIIKSGVPVVTTIEKEEALEIVEEAAVSKSSKMYRLGSEFNYNNVTYTDEGEHFDFSSPYKTYEQLPLKMKGPHQVKNASAALMALEYLRTFYGVHYTEENLRKGLEKASWVGRFEEISESPKIILDGAHNVDGVKSLAETISQFYPEKNVKVIFAALKDKDFDSMLQHLYPIVKSMTFTSFDFPRAAKAEELYEAAKFENKMAVENWRDAIGLELDNITENEMLIVTGSLYFISDVRKFLKNEKEF
ncbi:bifunctional folylpolyglutamate synthase/dihydrofolate synthase [Pseudalkalibacillus caeni]|uniref:Dihydrofolate synthase/folylpolyglutamate synthase n=1 Tax=Exobacillus caeni TaxID=2574798 RepID=A0A5R9FF62_9BACL|nr:folylpolyglutamate synthase/dihydrofolate synthase family protein [Pseudalkalibacillus caeni]TLS39224.1 bifunctional folylpolyglutamate synthase/dihydrofolate synthase [Pseudalkalibacillus caeni]